MTASTMGAHLGRLKRAIGWVVALTATGFFVQRVLTNVDRIPRVVWSATNVWVAIASVLLALGAIGLAGGVWQVLLRDQGIRRPLARVQSLYMVAQFGKYLPGNVGQFVGRVLLAKTEGIAVPVTMMTMATEVLWGIGTALGISSLSMLLFVGHRVATLPPWLDAAGLGVCFVVLLTAPWIGILLLKRMFPRLMLRALGDAEMTPPGWRAALQVTLLSVLSYLCMGLVLQLQSHYWFGAAEAPLLEVGGFFALAWLAGYVLPGAPAGIGVRESVMLLLFSPLFGEATALALGVTLRLATTLADALAFLIGSGWRLLLARRQ
ncbi:hypothetical protein EC912_10288 [Luteibacter rhizovicinus]|uniref:Lysylphosphatidylglycerol synthase-like protein n=1 Tax=Luteibacter rhizovicinus TaxID=242606 RepID=A0A4R3YWE5_9GAMM|nr:lysylphosphatidylglycerol synthase transmembrane domain-containing protein [Luteibacter rhizovicinus]TCV95744.1 hypothetical protein EC912_10288 [Luteibacter rhizovicinus]